MNFWTKINTRWDENSLRGFSSIFRVLYLLFPLVIYYLSCDITEVILYWLLNMGLSNASAETLTLAAKYSGTLQGMIYGIGIVVALSILSKAGRNEITYVPEGKVKRKFKFTDALLLILIALVTSIGLNYLLTITGIASSSAAYDSARDAQYSVNIVSAIVLYGIVSPCVEEVMFRGILYNRLKRTFPLVLSIVLQALLFGVFHGNIVQGIYGTLMGLLIGYAYERYETFIAPVIIHITANLGVYLITYFMK